MITYSVEIIAAFAAIITFKKFKKTNVRYFLYIVIYIALMELIGGYPSHVINFEFLEPIKEFLKGTLVERNTWYYNIFWRITGPLFYSFYFMRIIRSKSYSHIIRVSRLIFLILAVSYIIVYPNQLFEKAIVFNSILGTFLILISIVFYFIEVLKSDLILSFTKSINFYIASILFICYLVVITPIVFFDIYFNTADWNFILLKWQIYLMMNVFMYLGFALLLILCKPENIQDVKK